MHKKVLALSCIFILLIYFVGVCNAPLFKDYANAHTIYLGQNSSNAIIKKTNDLGCTLSFNKYGESCNLNIEDFDLTKFIANFSAIEVFTERLEEGISRYYYSPKIKYLQIIGGKKVNLQVFIGGDKVTLGAPMIYGSF